jgi:hypothetical protein
MYDSTTRIVTFRLSKCAGAHSEELFAAQFKDKLQAIRIQGQEWFLLVDLKACAPQSLDHWRIVACAIRLAKEAGMKEKALLAYRLSPSLYRHGYIQGTEDHIYFYFQSEHDALRWLLYNQYSGTEHVSEPQNRQKI